ncbi:MAG: hypothetical protein D8B42_10460, partial [Kingella sp. (in: b-proteobacteria)]
MNPPFSGCLLPTPLTALSYNRAHFSSKNFRELTMDKLKIIANGKLNGEITVSGAKNAALPLM